MHAGARGPMGRGMGATQPAWMTADTQPPRSGRSLPVAGRTVGPDAPSFVGNAGDGPRAVPRSFDVPRPTGSSRADARERELRQAMIASATTNRQRVAGAERAGELLAHSGDLQGAPGSPTSSSDGGSEDSESGTESEEARKARKKSKHSHKREKKSKHKKKKRKHKKEKSKKSHSSRR